MATYVAFLRAVNVGGHARVRMADLVDACAGAGCPGVRTYIASGNVVFDAPANGAKAVCEKIRGAVRRLVGDDACVVIRSLRELDDLIAKAPFNTLERNATLKLCVTFLADKTRVRPKLPLRSSKEAVDAIAMTDRDVFIVSRRKANGFYGFPNAFIEKELGVPATSRNWSTVTQVAEFARSRPVRSPRRSERVP